MASDNITNILAGRWVRDWTHRGWLEVSWTHLPIPDSPLCKYVCYRVDSSRYFQLLDSSPIRKMTRLESTAPNDSTRTRLADFCRKWLESIQLQLVHDKFIKIIVIVLLGKNNEPCETLSENIWGFAPKFIPDGHAYTIFLFLETTLVPQFLKWIFCTYSILILTCFFHF
jgi:hypothetical protein